MLKKFKISGPYIVFSKWSRKNYAIFSSLKKMIKIGRLSIEICDKALLKPGTINNLIFFKGAEEISNTETDKQNSDLSEQFRILAQLLLKGIVIPNIQNINAGNTKTGKILQLYNQSPFYVPCIERTF